MAIATVNNQNLPFTGPFGVGIARTYATAGTYNFVVPDGIANLRVRVWGGGAPGAASWGGSGGGFSFKTIYGVTSGSTIVVTVGVNGSGTTSGGTSSFGSYCSATGGTYASTTAGTGTGGDINYSGGTIFNNANAGGGGCGNLFGNGGNGAPSGATNGTSGASGGGGGANVGYGGGDGLVGTGAVYISASLLTPATSGFNPYSLDFIGCGGGGVGSLPGVNGGGGGGASGRGGFPGGGGGSLNANGGSGLVIVEY